MPLLAVSLRSFVLGMVSTFHKGWSTWVKERGALWHWCTPTGLIFATLNSFVNTDYALAHALSGANELRWIKLSYDMWCSYHKNLKKRFAKHFPHAAKILDNMRGAIPKLHVKNHIEACQLLWAFNYLEYSGETCGELIETGWSEGNQAAGSTKEMNDGHRHDMLDDYHGYWNWTKLHRLGLHISDCVIWSIVSLHRLQQLSWCSQNSWDQFS